MEKKFTQGEWKITHESLDKDTYEGYIRIGTYKSIWIAEAKGSHVGPESIDEIRSNAKLIAAAPDLLEALLGLASKYKSLADSGDCGDCGVWKAEDQTEFIKAENAIKKALE